MKKATALSIDLKKEIISAGMTGLMMVVMAMILTVIS